MYDDLVDQDRPAGWPETLPEDLGLTLRDALSYPSCNPQDIWDSLRDWLVANNVAPTDEIDQRPIPPHGPIGSTRFGRHDPA